MTLQIDKATDPAVATGSQGVARPRLRSFLSTWKLVAGVAIVLLFGVVALVGPWIAPYDPSALGDAALASPSGAHWLGTTQTGQDVLSQLVVGARPAMLYGFLAAVIATPLSVLVGVTAGYAGGVVDEVLSAITNVFLVVPLLPLLITVSGYLSRGGHSSYLVVTLIVGLTGWAWGARVLRAQSMAIRAGDYIEAARAYGERRWRIVATEMLPNMLTIVASSFLFTVLFSVILQASLAFLGLVDVQQWSWGTMLYWAQNNDALAAGAWWWFIPPGLCIAILGAGLALANFGIDEVVNPRLRTDAGGREWRSLRRSAAVRQGLTPVLRAAAADDGDWCPASELPASGEPVLAVRGLCVRYGEGAGAVNAVADADLTLHAGEVLGLVGESGSGKSTLAYALVRLVRRPGVITAGRVWYRPGADEDSAEPLDLLDAPLADLRALHWRGISLVPQSAMRALNPVLTIGAQLVDVFARHRPDLSIRARREHSAELLRMVNLDPGVMRNYPHQLSGGMRQRVAIAMALALRPRVVIMDEPTSALDVVTQRELLGELARLRHHLGFAILFITHDLPLLTEFADSVAIMYRGRIVECAPAATLRSTPRHPYSRHLFGSFLTMHGTARPGVGTAQPAHRDKGTTGCVFEAATPQDVRSERAVGSGERVRPILAAAGVSMHYRSAQGRNRTYALDGVGIELPEASITAVVGQTGSGKTTLVRILAGLIRPTSGTVALDGAPLRVGSERSRRRHSESVQLVLQDPFSSLNPVHTVRHHLARPLLVHRVVGRRDLDARIDELLDQVALRPAGAFRNRFPHELSGGQLQRVAIARALAVAPRILLADEPVSMLDVSVRLGILDLLAELRERTSMALLYVTHDIASARYLSDTVAVMYAGRVVEHGSATMVTKTAAHPYTQLLLETAQGWSRDSGSPPASTTDRLAPPAERPGCPFRSSCPHAMPKCESEPPTIKVDTGHVASCWLLTADRPSATR